MFSLRTALAPPIDGIWALMFVEGEEGTLSELFCAVLCIAIVHSGVHMWA